MMVRFSVVGFQTTPFEEVTAWQGLNKYKGGNGCTVRRISTASFFDGHEAHTSNFEHGKDFPHREKTS
jgi:hypothetical protein